jgi:esterase/lipase
MIQWIVIVVIILLLLLLYIYNVISHNESKILFFDRKKNQGWRPRQKYTNLYLNINNHKDIVHKKNHRNREDAYIHCWHFNNYKGASHVLYMHGQSGTVKDRAYIIEMAERFKVNLFLFDYSGYGESCGKPDKIMLRENTETVYNYMHQVGGIPNTKIICWSESLGCISAAYLCSKYKLGGLILLSAFSSLDDILHYHLEGYKQTGAKLLTKVLGTQMDFLPVKDYLKEVKCPVVVIHSEDDEIIPYECANINYRSISHKNKLFVKIEGGHSSPKIHTKQLRKIFRFCDLPHDNCGSETVDNMLKNLETYAKKHNNFMD